MKKQQITDQNNILGTKDFVGMNNLNDLTDYMETLTATDLTDLLNNLVDRINNPATNTIETSKQLIAFLLAFFQNTTKLIGVIPGIKNIGEYISEFVAKLSNTVNTSLLLTATIQALGIGLYNTKNNGLPGGLHYDIDTKFLSFRLGSITALLVRDGNYLMEEVGNKEVTLNLSTIMKPGTIIELRIIVLTDRNNTANMIFFQNLSIGSMDIGEESHLFFVREERIAQTINAYTTLLNQQNFFELFSFIGEFNTEITPRLLKSKFIRSYDPIQPFTYLYNNMLKALNGDGLTLNIPKTGFDGIVAPLNFKKIKNIGLNLAGDGEIPDEAVIYFLPAGIQYINDIDIELDYVYKWERRTLLQDNWLTINPRFKNRTSDTLSMSDDFILYCSSLVKQGSKKSSFILNLSYYQNNDQELFTSIKINPELHNNCWLYPLNTGVTYRDPIYFEESTRPLGNDNSLASEHYIQIENHIFGGFSARSLKDKSIKDSKLDNKTILNRSLADECIKNRNMEWTIEDPITKEPIPQFPINNMADQLKSDRLDYGIGTSYNNLQRQTGFSIFKSPRICISPVNANSAITFSTMSIASNKALNVHYSDYRIDHSLQSEHGGKPMARNKIIRDPDFYAHGLILHQNFNAPDINIGGGARTVLERQMNKSLAMFLHTYKVSANIIETGAIILSTNPALMGEAEILKQRCDIAITVHRENADVPPTVGFYDASDDSAVDLLVGGLQTVDGNDFTDNYPTGILFGHDDIDKIYPYGFFYGINKTTFEIKEYSHNDVPLGFVSNMPSIKSGNTDIAHFPKAIIGIVEILKHQVFVPTTITDPHNLFGYYVEPYGKNGYTLIVNQKRTFTSVARILQTYKTININGYGHLIVELLT